ncbi:hypothetical protein HYQ46_005127 [Verticillium longisporum]|nr:hypothetical protein HYQ46_005127 [Verticillium longisporum]
MEKRISDFARWEAGVWLERKDGGFLRNQWSLHALENGTLVVNRVKPRDHKAAARNSECGEPRDHKAAGRNSDCVEE